MRLDPSQLKPVLSNKKIDSLYHANTVPTASNFIRHRKLLSRGRTEELGLSQTEQASDDIDKDFGVWNLIFTDSVDIHQRAKRRNVYGPVLLKMNLDILEAREIEWVGITKKNPTKWSKDEDDSERWFMSIEEAQNDFVKGRFDQMIVFKCEDGELDLIDRLTLIKLDDPKARVRGKVDLFSLGLGAIAMARVVGGMNNVRIRRRNCHEQCACGRFYRNTHLREKVLKVFDPREAA
jgi:hypothetical protein